MPTTRNLSKTKSLVRFQARAAHLDCDIELVDVIHESIRRGRLHSTSTTAIFYDVTKTRHPRLFGRTSTDHSRRLAVQHLKSTLCEAFIKNIYEDMVQYFFEILTSAARNGLDPGRLIGEHKTTFTANEILTVGNWPGLVELVSKSVFRSLENERNSKNLITKLNSKLGLNVHSSIIDDAMAFIEIRHLLVHNEGKADRNFCSSFPSFALTTGKAIKLNNNLLEQARSSISRLVLEFDQQVVAGNLLSPDELQS